MFGTFKAMGVVGSFLMRSLKALEIAFVSIAPIPTGLVMTILGGVIIKKYKCYILMISIAFIGSAGTMMIFYLFLKLENFWYDFIGFALVGIFAVFPTPIMIEYGVEVTFPTSDSLSVGILFAGG